MTAHLVELFVVNSTFIYTIINTTNITITITIYTIYTIYAIYTGVTANNAIYSAIYIAIHVDIATYTVIVCSSYTRVSLIESISTQGKRFYFEFESSHSDKGCNGVEAKHSRSKCEEKGDIK